MFMFICFIFVFAMIGVEGGSNTPVTGSINLVQMINAAVKDKIVSNCTPQCKVPDTLQICDFHNWNKNKVPVTYLKDYHKCLGLNKVICKIDLSPLSIPNVKLSVNDVTIAGNMNCTLNQPINILGIPNFKIEKINTAIITPWFNNRRHLITQVFRLMRKFHGEIRFELFMIFVVGKGNYTCDESFPAGQTPQNGQGTLITGKYKYIIKANMKIEIVKNPTRLKSITWKMVDLNIANDPITVTGTISVPLQRAAQKWLQQYLIKDHVPIAVLTNFKALLADELGTYLKVKCH